MKRKCVYKILKRYVSGRLTVTAVESTSEDQVIRVVEKSMQENGGPDHVVVYRLEDNGEETTVFADGNLCYGSF